MMGRIKFGGDDEPAETPAVEEEETKEEVSQGETVKFDQNENDSEVRIGKRTSRLCKFQLFTFDKYFL